MIELGKKDELFGIELLEPLNLRVSELRAMPALKSGHSILCGYDQGLGERMIVCENLNDIKELDAAYERGGALRIKWYSAPDPGFITVLEIPEKPETSEPTPKPNDKLCPG